MEINWPCFSHSRVDKKAQQLSHAADLSRIVVGGGGVAEIMAAAEQPARHGSLPAP